MGMRITNTACSICPNGIDSTRHLFFYCSFSHQLLQTAC